MSVSTRHPQTAILKTRYIKVTEKINRTKIKPKVEPTEEGDKEDCRSKIFLWDLCNETKTL